MAKGKKSIKKKSSRAANNPTLRDALGAELFENIAGDDPFVRAMAAVPWQAVTGGLTYVEDVSEYFDTPQVDEKKKLKGWRKLQNSCWQTYKTYGPVTTAINRDADLVTGYGFGVYSTIVDINEFLFDLFYSYRNKLYAACNGWVVRMRAEGELFLVIAFDEEAKATIRALEPDRIGDGDDDGLVTHPGDISTTLFYKYKKANGEEEYIPDISVLLNPEILKEAQRDDKEFRDKFKDIKNKSKGSLPLRNKGKFNKIGGYRRFVVHWKNLTGINEYKRDVAALSAALEAIRLYWNSIKYQLDHKKAQSAYTNVIEWKDGPFGKLGYAIWTKMTPEEKAKTGLTKPLTPGSTVFTVPGMEFSVKSPNLQKLSGENQDLLNVAGAGMRTPPDLFQGETKGSSYSSVKASRPPMIFDAKSLQHKFGNFLLYELLRACIHAVVMMGSPNYKIKDLYPLQVVKEMKGGNPSIGKVKVEPVRFVGCRFPRVSVIDQPDQKANAYLGSKHAGLRSIGMSGKGIAEEMGIQDYDMQIRAQALEEEMYGKPETGPEAEQRTEEKPTEGDRGGGKKPQE